MIYQNVPNLYLLQRKFQKACRQLQRLLQIGSSVCTKKINSLIKRRERYLKQILSVKLSPVKAGSALAVAMLLASQTQAQQCNQYVDANAANPLARVKNGGDYRPVFVDIDGDGDLDCFVKESGYLSFFKNIGTKEIPVFNPSTADGFTGPVYIGEALQFADLDGDGDYDCFVTGGYHYWYVTYFENTGTKTNPVFVENDAKNPLSFVRGSYGLGLNIADIDGDGDYDVFTADIYSYHIYGNKGTKTQPSFTPVAFGASRGVDNRIYYDWNKDGLIDYIDYIHYIDNDGLIYYRNIGPTAGEPHYVLDPNGPNFSVFGSYGLFSLTDINGDGAPEAFSFTCDMATVTQVPVITGSTYASVNKLSASPKNKNYKYQWQRNGKNIAGATKDNLFTSTSGLYTVEITNTCGTGVSLPYQLQTNASSFDEAEASTVQFTHSLNTTEQPLLKAYPNPFANHFMLDLGNNFSPNTMVRITDAQGRMLSSLKAKTNVLQLGSNLQKGIYIIQVIQNNTVVFTQKIIKE